MGRGGGRSRSTPARRPPPPRPAQSGQSSGGQSMMGGFLGNMVQGFAFGTGSSVAREAVHGIMGGSSNPAPAPEVQQQAPQIRADICEFDQKALLACLNNNPGNAQSCDVYMDALRSCQANSN